MSEFFASGGQSIGVSTSTSVFPMNIQDWFPLLVFYFDLLDESIEWKDQDLKETWLKSKLQKQ